MPEMAQPERSSHRQQQVQGTQVLHHQPHDGILADSALQPGHTEQFKSAALFPKLPEHFTLPLSAAC